MPTETMTDEQLIEGGEITGVGEAEYKVDPLKKERAQTTKILAYILISILAFSFVVHYGVISWITISGKSINIDILDNAFTTWLPVISGLASSAVTYYFTKEQ